MSVAMADLAAPRSRTSLGLRRLVRTLRPNLPTWLALLALLALTLMALLPDTLASLADLRPARTSRFAWLGQYMLSDPATIAFWTRMLQAARATLEIGIGSAAVALVIGGATGLLAATRIGSLLGHPILWLLAVLRVFPPLVLAIVAIVALGTGDIVLGATTVTHPVKLMLVIGALCASQVAAVTRAALRAQREAPHLAAERALGASGLRVALIMLRNSIGPMVTSAALLVGPAILCEASLSFLGLGVQPPASSWGGMLAASLGAVAAGEWRPVVIPGVLILATVCAFNVIAQTLRARLDRAGINARSDA